MRATVRGLMAGFEGAALDQAEDVHAEFFEIFGKHELAWWVRAGEALAVAGEDVDGFFGEGVADIFQGAFSHAG